MNNTNEKEMKVIAGLLQVMEKASLKRDQELADKISGAIFEIQMQNHASAWRQHKELLVASYHSATNYSNLICLAGYAGLFGLWQMTKELIPTNEAFWIALLMACSLICFVGFELFKMINQSNLLRRLNRVSEMHRDKPEYVQAWKQVWDDHSAAESRMWSVFLWPTVLTGFGAGIWLVKVFITGILRSA